MPLIPHLRPASIVVLLAVTAAAAAPPSLVEVRDGFETTITRTVRDAEPLAPPPAELFDLVTYPGPIGAMSAYVGKPTKANTKHAAIIWITGGFPPGGVGASAWMPMPVDNDQSAKAYREAGLVMMYPALRGSFGNPGVQESFYGEVDDVLAALAYVRGLDFVDPERVFLGGHSTGGTLALLVAAATNQFAGVFAFGPVGDPADYGRERITYDPSDKRERRLRAPMYTMNAIRTPTFVFEGTDGNLSSLQDLDKVTSDGPVRFFPVAGATHFDILAPLNRLIAGRIAAGGSLTLSAAEVEQAYRSNQSVHRESDDLDMIAALRRRGVDLHEPRRVVHSLIAPATAPLDAAGVKLAQAGFIVGSPARVEDDGDVYFVLEVTKRYALADLEAVFAASAALEPVARAHDLYYGGWTVR